MNMQTGIEYGSAVRNAADVAVDAITNVKLDDVKQTAQNALAFAQGFWTGLTAKPVTTKFIAAK
jgi:hypothetical protein